MGKNILIVSQYVILGLGLFAWPQTSWSHLGISALPPFTYKEVPWKPTSAGNILTIYNVDQDDQVYQNQSQPCLEASHLYFQVKDDWAYDIDERVKLVVQFDAQRGIPQGLTYDGYNSQKFSPPIIDPPTNDNLTVKTTVTATFILERARFANIFSGNNDFILGGFNSPTFGICDIEIKRQNLDATPNDTGRLKIKITEDGKGSKPLSAKVGLYNQNGKFIEPNDQALPIYLDSELKHTEGCVINGQCPTPFTDLYSFYVRGRYKKKLAVGTYRLIVSKGPEYRVFNQEIQVQKGKTTKLTVNLKRYYDMPANGWYSGDTHVHIPRTQKKNKDILAVMRATDLHATQILQMGNMHDTYYNQSEWHIEGQSPMRIDTRTKMRVAH